MQHARDRRRYLPIFFALLGIVLFINLFSPTDYRSSSLKVGLSLSAGCRGQTRVLLPPVGEIRARTHWLPVQLTLELKSINLSFLRALVFSAPQVSKPLLDELQGGLRLVLLLFGLKVLGLAAAGAVSALLLLGIRDPKNLLWAAVLGLFLVALFAGGLFYSYDLSAFERMEYEGAIEAAPWALNLAWEALGKVEELGERVRSLAANLYAALQQLEELGPVGLVEAEIIALHVSDIHNNPVAYDFVQQVLESFPVDFVLDTGDLTDWGTALEAEVAGHIEKLQIPYAFIAGNHESPEMLKRLEAVANVVMIGEEIQTVCGLKIAGAEDPAARFQLPETAAIKDLNELAEAINSKWLPRQERPGIFMVHNHRVAAALAPGLFPVVVYGHTHRQELKQVGDTVYINGGSTGAAGIRGFQSREPVPYSLALLYFGLEGEEPVLKAVDNVQITGLGGSFALQRTFIQYGRNTLLDVEMIR